MYSALICRGSRSQEETLSRKYPSSSEERTLLCDHRSRYPAKLSQKSYHCLDLSSRRIRSRTHAHVALIFATIISGNLSMMALSLRSGSQAKKILRTCSLSRSQLHHFRTFVRSSESRNGEHRSKPRHFTFTLGGITVFEPRGMLESSDFSHCDVSEWILTRQPSKVCL